MTETDLHTGLRAWARGIYPLEAGVELLIRTGLADRLREPVVGPSDDGRLYWLDRAEYAARVLDSGTNSGGERRLFAIAGSLLEVRPVDLSDAVSGIDRAHVDVVLAAVAHASGSHEHSAIEVGEGGRAKISRLTTLHEWPT